MRFQTKLIMIRSMYELHRPIFLIIRKNGKIYISVSSGSYSMSCQYFLTIRVCIYGSASIGPGAQLLYGAARS